MLTLDLNFLSVCIYKSILLLLIIYLFIYQQHMLTKRTFLQHNSMKHHSKTWIVLSSQPSDFTQSSYAGGHLAIISIPPFILKQQYWIISLFKDTSTRLIKGEHLSYFLQPVLGFKPIPRHTCVFESQQFCTHSYSFVHQCSKCSGRHSGTGHQQVWRGKGGRSCRCYVSTRWYPPDERSGTPRCPASAPAGPEDTVM